MRVLNVVLAAGVLAMLSLSAFGQHRGSGAPRSYPSRPGATYRGGAVYVPVPVPVGGAYLGGYPVAPLPYDPGYAGYDPSLAYGYGPAPAVVVNPNFQPDAVNPVVRDYSNLTDQPPNVTQLSPQAPRNVQSLDSPQLRDDQPTIFLIAMKDHTIYPVIAYWVEKDMLKYVTVETVVKSVPLDQVDRDLSIQLNQQRNLDFRLPAR